MANKNKFLTWQHTKAGASTSGLVCLVLAYLFFSLSINSGNLFYYIITLLFIVYGLKFIFRFIGDIFHAVFR